MSNGVSYFCFTIVLLSSSPNPLPLWPFPASPLPSASSQPPVSLLPVYPAWSNLWASRKGPCHFGLSPSLLGQEARGGQVSRLCQRGNPRFGCAILYIIQLRASFSERFIRLKNVAISSIDSRSSVVGEREFPEGGIWDQPELIESETDFRSTTERRLKMGDWEHDWKA